MGFLDFSETLFLKVSETDEIFLATGFSAGDRQQLKHIVLTLFNVGTATADDRFRLKLFHDQAMTKLYATSSWLNLSDIEGLSDSWIGRVRFDFSEPWLGAADTYYLAVEADGYVRDGDTRYVGWALDWPVPVYATNPPPNCGLAFEVYGYRSVAL